MFRPLILCLNNYYIEIVLNCKYDSHCFFSHSEVLDVSYLSAVLCYFRMKSMKALVVGMNKEDGGSLGKL